jgi:hypothetical protein
MIEDCIRAKEEEREMEMKEKGKRKRKDLWASRPVLEKQLPSAGKRATIASSPYLQPKPVKQLNWQK